MISAFYSYYNICKNFQLDEFCDTPQLIQFLRQIPELEQTGPHHFSNSKDFNHYLSLTLLYAAPQDSWSDEETTDKQINLIVVVSSSLNNAPFFVKPILRKISQHLNWQLVCEEDEEDKKRTGNGISNSANKNDGNNNEDDDRDADDDRDDINKEKNTPASSAPYLRLDDDDDEEDEDEDDNDDQLNLPSFNPN